MKLIKLAVAVATIGVVGLLFGVVDSQARRATTYESPRMPDFTTECQQLTKVRTRVSYRFDHEATARCVQASEAQWRQNQVDSSYIEANKASAELDRERARYLRTR
jgi:hypothetical protein